MIPTFSTALALERTLAQLLLEEQRNNPPLSGILLLQAGCQSHWLAVLSDAAAQAESFPVYPSVEADQLTVAEQTWNSALADVQETGLETGQLLRLGALAATYDLLADYYRQAQANEPHPATKLFFSSCIEIKRLQKTAIEKLYRLASHEVWKNVGFSPVSR